MKRLALLVCAAVCFDCQGYDCNGHPISLSTAITQAQAKATVNGAPGYSCFTLDPPGSTPQAVTGDGGACATATGDDDCVVCVKTSCCAESVSCMGNACACLIACQIAGGTVSSCEGASACNAAPDASYSSAKACIADNCAAACGGRS